MLHFISWRMYGISLVVGLIFFYGYVGYKNLRLFTRFVGRLWAAAGGGEQGSEPGRAAPGKEAQEPDGEKRELGEGLQDAKESARPTAGNDGTGANVEKAVVLLALLVPAAAWAQTADGAAGINQANTMIRSYFDPAVNLMYAAGALAGIYGGYKVYRSMNNKDHDADNRATVWFAGCIFLVLVATVLKSFFGI